MNVVGRLSLLFMLYTYVVFFGSPPILVILQMLALAASTVVVVINAAKQKTKIFSSFFYFVFFAFLSYLALNIIIALDQAKTPTNIIIRFLENFLTTFSLPLLAYSFERLAIISHLKLLRHTLHAAFLFALVKCALVALIAALGVPIPIIQILSLQYFNASPTFDVLYSGVVRLMLASDFLLPFVIYYLLRSTDVRFFIKLLYLCVFATSIFLSFSRFIWIETVAAIAIYCCSFDRRRLLVISFLMTTSIPLVVYYAPTDLIERRFSSSATAASDLTRYEEFDVLSENVDQYFMSGHGFASYALNLIRDPQSPYAYELQWVGFIYQMGLIGVLFLMALAAFNIGPLVLSANLNAFPFVLLFIFYILSGFANPALVGRSPSAILMFVLCIGLSFQTQTTKRTALEAVG